jgi:hypothetical protein
MSRVALIVAGVLVLSVVPGAVLGTAAAVRRCRVPRGGRS